MPKPIASQEDEDPTPYLFVSLEQKRIDQSKPYDSKKTCWIPDEKEGYLLGEIKATKGDIVSVGVPGGETRDLKKDLLSQVNPPKYEKAEDMSNLTYLNDASVLHNLKQRYYHKLIYTYSGLFCVAINPYKRYPVYTNRCAKMYRGKRRNEVPPHIFAISDGAYVDMLTNHTNQSMLITGESGAGKTENTKKVIAYFATVGASGKKDDPNLKKGNLEDQVVQTNPVLEAFGNAKTVRNDNSSRFGKFIRIHFGPSGKLAGADIETYLLEKARVISQQSLERSYHIFYQIMSGSVAGVKDMCFLTDNIYDYYNVSQGKVTIPSMDDGEEFTLTDQAFDILGFTTDEKENVYRITAAVMHMGGMKFKQRGREEQAEADGTEEGERVAKLFGCDCQELYKNLLKPRIKVGNEFVTQGRNKDQVSNSIGALCKGVFDRLFKWLVKKCNETLDTKQKRQHFIGVLDIAGFEIFDYNGFEQLCINFTNEKLQQFFNHIMFVLEQEEYTREGIHWDFIDFGMDLLACIELIEKPMGILSILEEESMFPKATDQTFAEKLTNNHLGKSAPFRKPAIPKPGNPAGHFAIAHYAGCVSYNITGWLEKNKDPLNDTVVDQFKKSTNKLLIEIFADHPGQSGGGEAAKGGRGKKGGGFATVSSSYKEQLNNLMSTLRSTQPHFVRCIIPNETKSPGVIDSHLVMHQLTCNGVLEGIRICRKGFPNRMVYPDFKLRYKILNPKGIEGVADLQKAAQIILESTGLDAETYRIGNTKVFFRAGVLGQMEEFRDERLGKIMSWMQSWIRGYLARKEYKKIQEQRLALQVVQRNLRKYMQLRTWPWWKLWQKVKPLLNVSRVEDEIAKLEEKAKKAEEALAAEEKVRKDLEVLNSKLLAEKTALLESLAGEKGSLQDFQEKTAKLTAQKNDLDNQLRDTQERLSQEEDARNQLFQQKKKIEQEVSGLKKDIEDLELANQKTEQDKATKDHQIRSLNDEIAHQDELINKLNKEKKMQGENNQKTGEELQAAEDKINHLNKVKSKLEQTLDELEDSLEREKKLRGDVEKAKRKVEGDLKLTQEAVADLERNKKELEQTIQRKDKEISSLTAKLEDEQSVVRKSQSQIKELQSRIEELEEEVEAERQARSKAEKQRADLARELEELGERLEEAGGATSAQIELNKKREAELSKLRRDLEEANIQHEGTLANLRKKHNDAVAEMAEQVDQLNKLKAKAEKEKSQYFAELNDIRSSTNRLSSDKANAEAQKNIKRYQQQLKDIQTALEEEQRARDDAREQLGISERRANALQNELEESRTLLEQADRGRRQAEQELGDAHEQLNEVAAQNASISAAKRKLESELQTLHSDLDELLNEAKNSEEKAKKAMVDAARLADELRAEQDHAQTQEKLRKALEIQIKELQVRLDEAEANALKGGKKAIQKLEHRVRELENELDGEQRRHADAQKNLRKSERRIKELTFQSEEDRKNHERMQDLVDKLQQKIKTYKRQIEEAEEIAALNLAKFRKAQQELEESEERADLAEQAISKFRTKGRAGSAARGASPQQSSNKGRKSALALD